MSEDQKRIGFLQKAIAKGEQLLGKMKAEEAKSRANWTKRYKRFVNASATMAELKNVATKKAAELREVIKSWPEDTEKLTKERDQHREAIRKQEEELQKQRTELAVLGERMRNMSTETDGIVDQVFKLNDAAVAAFKARNDYLTGNVYKLLIDDNGKLRSQITLTSSDGMKRVVAMVNHLSKLDPALAGEAKDNIDRFFERFKDTSEAGKEPQVVALLDILKGVLIEKIHFKVGPDLYRFLTVEINEDLFPELKKAQLLLRGSLRSEKTNSYVRLYRNEGDSKKPKWVEVKLS